FRALRKSGSPEASSWAGMFCGLTAARMWLSSNKIVCSQSIRILRPNAKFAYSEFWPDLRDKPRPAGKVFLAVKSLFSDKLLSGLDLQKRLCAVFPSLRQACASPKDASLPAKRDFRRKRK